jgi:glutamate N-acetyltransferase/amino-acid N-acetyltransferase
MGVFEAINQPNITSPKGFRAAGIHAGLKKKKLDLGVLICDVPATAAAVYTMNAFQAAPITVTKLSMKESPTLRAIVVNSGQANAGTGERGRNDALATRQKMADLIGVSADQVALASTGVIGELIPMDPLLTGLEQIIKQVDQDPNHTFAQAILTTDTCTKMAEAHVKVDGKLVKIAGVAKGSGMIHPNMATMLSFVTTDAVIEASELQALLSAVVNDSFNMISVDGDCSTNDMVAVMASGLAGNETLSPTHPDWTNFQAAFQYVCQELAKMIAKDGEGATKLIEVEVVGAPTEQLARVIARAVTSSNLVKTAIFGSDANWGRILCAVGYSAPGIDTERTDIYIDSILVSKEGGPSDFDEEEVVKILNRENVLIKVDLKQGEYKATAWGCDLTYDYVKINGSYRS